MLETLLGSFLKDALKHKLDLKGAYGEQYPKELVDYVVNVSEKQFLKDVRGAIDYVKFGFEPEARGILDALAAYVAGDFSRRFDIFDRSFFFSQAGERIAKLKDVFAGDSFFQAAVRDMVMSGTYQELAESAQDIVQKLKEAPTVVIQSAVEIPSELRMKVREVLNKKFPTSFIEFQINPQIIGGLRVFIDGQVTDHSWLSQIQRISQITNQFT